MGIFYPILSQWRLSTGIPPDPLSPPQGFFKPNDLKEQALVAQVAREAGKTPSQVQDPLAPPRWDAPLIPHVISCPCTPGPGAPQVECSAGSRCYPQGQRGGTPEGEP